MSVVTVHVKGPLNGLSLNFLACPIDGDLVGFDIVGLNSGNPVFELIRLVVVGAINGETVV